MQFRQRLCQILGVHNLVRRILVLHLPAHWRTWWRTDEEQLVALWQRQVLICGVHGRIDAKVDADSVAHDCLAVERLADGDGVGRVKEGYDDALEGLQRRPRMNFCVDIDRLPDFCQGGGLEDLGCKQVLVCALAVRIETRLGDTHTVIIKVFEGGDGSTSGGRSERSSESGDLLLEDARECDGDGMVACMFAAAIMCVESRDSA